MANEYNAWLGLSQAFQTEMVDVIRDGGTAVTFPLINDLDDDTKAFLAGVYDSEATERLFRTWGGASYRCWNCYAIKPDNFGTVRADLDNLAASYPTDFSVVGAWHYRDGRPVGTSWSNDDPPILTGDAWYKQPPETLNFMPNVVVDDTDPENPVMGRPTDLSNVLLVFGQSARIFVKDGW